MKSNAQSLVTFEYLKQDCQKSLAYWQEQPESKERTDNLLRYTELYNKHDSAAQTVHTQAAAAGDDLKSDIEEVIAFIELVIRNAGSLLGEPVKAFLTALINAARKLLEILK